jgi:amidase
MGRTAEDVALMLQAIGGPSDLSPLAQPMAGRDFVAAVRSSVPPGTRVAYCADPAGIGIDADVERVCRDAAFGLIDSGLIVDEIDIDLSAARDAFLSLRGLWFVTQMFPRLDQASRFGVNVGNNVRAGLNVTTRDLASAEQQRGRIWHTVRSLFTRFDLIVTPCMAVPPFPVEHNYPDTIAGKPMENYVDWIAPTFVWSLTGLPIASVPAGRDRAGLPAGLQVVGPPRGEEAALRLAQAIQRLRPLAWRPPAEQD